MAILRWFVLFMAATLSACSSDSTDTRTPSSSASSVQGLSEHDRERASTEAASTREPSPADRVVDKESALDQPLGLAVEGRIDEGLSALLAIDWSDRSRDFEEPTLLMQESEFVAQSPEARERLGEIALRQASATRKLILAGVARAHSQRESGNPAQADSTLDSLQLFCARVAESNRIKIYQILQSLQERIRKERR